MMLIIQLCKKERRICQKGDDDMKKLLIMMMFYNISLLSMSKENIIMYYGIVKPNSVKYNFMDLTKNRIEITKSMVKVTDKNDLSDIIAEIPIKEKEYKKLEKMIRKIINKSVGEDCGDTWQIPDLFPPIEPKYEIDKINIKIIFQGKEYCMIERNDLIEYFEQKYDMDFEW